MVGKYTCLSDAYLSVLKDPEAYKVAWNLLKGIDGVLVPGVLVMEECKRKFLQLSMLENIVFHFWAFAWGCKLLSMSRDLFLGRQGESTTAESFNTSVSESFKST